MKKTTISISEQYKDAMMYAPIIDLKTKSDEFSFYVSYKFDVNICFNFRSNGLPETAL